MKIQTDLEDMSHPLAMDWGEGSLQSCIAPADALNKQ